MSKYVCILCLGPVPAAGEVCQGCKDDGYDIDDPKHSDWYERNASIADAFRDSDDE